MESTNVSVEFTPRQSEIASAWQNLNVLVVGDLMVDIDLHVAAGPPCPEGAGQLFVEQKQTRYPGGAANVAMNCAALGASVTLIGAAGLDPDGEWLWEHLLYYKIRCPWATFAARRFEWRGTTTKTRIYQDTQLLYRIDRDRNQRLPGRELFPFIEQEPFDLLLLSDYQKGALSDCKGWGMGNLVAAYRERNPGGYVGINPKPQLCCSPGFLNATYDLVSFNEKEWMAVYLEEGTWTQDHPIAKAMRYMLLTKGSRGLQIWNHESSVGIHVDALPVTDPNVVGAGDATFAAASMAQAAGCYLKEVAQIANAAGASKCGKQGTSPITPTETLQSIS